MSKIQRFLLILFSCVIFLISDSYSVTGTTIKFFLIAILLFFALCPVNWFIKNKSKQEKLEISQEEEPKKELIEKATDSLLPFIGFPTPENVLILKSLLKLRSAEITCIYRSLRDYQKTAGNDTWAALFMKEYAIGDLYRDFDLGHEPITKEEEKEAEVNAMEIYKKKYSNIFSH